MRIDEAFILGAFTGAITMWLLGRQIENGIDARTRRLRTAAADRLQIVEEAIRPGAASTA